MTTFVFFFKRLKLEHCFLHFFYFERYCETFVLITFLKKCLWGSPKALKFCPKVIYQFRVQVFFWQYCTDAYAFSEFIFCELVDINRISQISSNFQEAGCLVKLLEADNYLLFNEICLAQ